MKTCTKCKVEKPLDEFWRDSSHKDGRSTRCAECKRNAGRERYKRDHERILERQRTYYYANHERKLEHARRWREANPELHTERWRRSKLKSEFGITLERYNELLAEQDHCCKICGRHESEFTRRLAVDHCHKNGDVRALLCHGCNTGLGAFQDDPDLLMKAADYRLRFATGVG